MEIIKFSLKNISSVIKLMVYIILYAILSSLAIFLPYIMGKFIDILVYNRSLELWINVCCWIGGISVGKVILLCFRQILYADIFVNSAYKISRLLIEHIHSCPVGLTEKMDSAYYNQRISQDAGAVIDFSILVIAGGTANAIELVTSFVILKLISEKTLLIVALLWSIYVIVYVMLKKPIYSRGKANKEEKAIYFSKMYEQLYYTKFIKAHSLKEFFEKKLYEAFLSFQKMFMKHQKIVICMSSLDQLFVSLAHFFLYLKGGYEVFEKRMTVGSFMVINNYFSKLVNCTSFFFSLGESYQDAKISYNRICDILSWVEEKKGEMVLNEIDSIKLENVSIICGKKQVIDNLNVRFDKGKIYVIAGENGAGKSTLVQAILGLYNDKMQGDITFNGISVKQLDGEYLRENNISYLEQDAPLFTGTVEENIVLGKNKDLTLFKNVDEMNLLDFVKKMPNDYRNMIWSQTNNLSGGERQRIALARMFVNERDVIILDEPSNGLDMDVVHMLVECLIKLKEGKIIIINSHDQRIMDICDEIIYL